MLFANIFSDNCFNDYLSVVFSFINRGSDYKTINYVCKRWYNIMREVQPDADVKLCNHLLTLLKLFPDQEWDWHSLSHNPNMTLNFALSHLDKMFLNTIIKNELTKNTITFLEIIKENTDPFKKYKKDISSHPNITWELINNPGYKEIWDWEGISSNPNVTMDIVENNPDLPWIYENGLSKNINLTWDFIMDKFDDGEEWDWYNIFKYANKDLTIILLDAWGRFPPWDALNIGNWISLNKNITENDVNNNYDAFYESEEWWGLSYNYKLSWDFIMKNIEQDWSWDVLSSREDLTFEVIKNNVEAPWDWKELCAQKCVTHELIQKTLSNKLFKWDLEELTKNPNFSLKLIDEMYFDYWSYESITYNPNLTWKFVFNDETSIVGDLDRWDWHGISRNGFGKYVAPW